MQVNKRNAADSRGKMKKSILGDFIEDAGKKGELCLLILREKGVITLLANKKPCFEHK